MSGYNTNLVESESYVVGGNAARVYPLWFRVRAAVELTHYVGGTVEGMVNRGGVVPPGATSTRVKLVVAEPAQTIWLNHGGPTAFSLSLDYHVLVWAKGGTTLTLSLERGDHTMYQQDAGGGTVQTTLDPFDGEFVQLDFETTLTADVVEQRAALGTTRDWLFSGYEDNVLGIKAEE